jgi:hypothetical protein
MVIGRRLYWNADRSKIVEHGDPESAFLAFSESKDVPNEIVDRFNLDATKEKAVSKPPATKAKAKAPETK